MHTIFENSQWHRRPNELDCARVILPISEKGIVNGDHVIMGAQRVNRYNPPIDNETR